MNAISLPLAGPATLLNRSPAIIIEELRDAARREKAANADRVALEAELLEAMERFQLIEPKKEGSKTVTVENYKVKVTWKLNRKAVAGGIEKIQALGLEELTPVKVKHELDEKGLKYLQDNDPEVYARVAKFVETKPAKPAVEVTRED